MQEHKRRPQTKLLSVFFSIWEKYSLEKIIILKDLNQRTPHLKVELLFFVWPGLNTMTGDHFGLFLRSKIARIRTTNQDTLLHWHVQFGEKNFKVRLWLFLAFIHPIQPRGGFVVLIVNGLAAGRNIIIKKRGPLHRVK